MKRLPPIATIIILLAMPAILSAQDAEPQKIQVTQTGMNLLLTHYGPYAFGGVLLLALWQTIVKPQLDRRMLDFEAQQEIIKALSATAATLERTAEKLEQLVDKKSKQLFQQSER